MAAQGDEWNGSKEGLGKMGGRPCVIRELVLNVVFECQRPPVMHPGWPSAEVMLHLVPA